MTERIFSLDWKHGWETMSGKPVRILATDLRGRYPIAGTVSYDEGDSLEGWTAEGKYDGLDRSTSSLDLRNRPAPKVKKTVWMALMLAPDSPAALVEYSEPPLLRRISHQTNAGWTLIDRFEREIEVPAEAS